MYAVIRSYPGNREFADALVENESDVKRIISGIDGFRAYYLIKTDDGAASISVFDDRNGAEESSRQAGDWLRENLGNMSIGPPGVTAGEVVISA